jgi:hypothetical protein
MNYTGCYIGIKEYHVKAMQILRYKIKLGVGLNPDFLDNINSDNVLKHYINYTLTDRGMLLNFTRWYGDNPHHWCCLIKSERLNMSTLDWVNYYNAKLKS